MFSFSQHRHIQATAMRNHFHFFAIMESKPTIIPTLFYFSICRSAHTSTKAKRKKNQQITLQWGQNLQFQTDMKLILITRWHNSMLHYLPTHIWMWIRRELSCVCVHEHVDVSTDPNVCVCEVSSGAASITSLFGLVLTESHCLLFKSLTVVSQLGSLCFVSLDVENLAIS